MDSILIRLKGNQTVGQVSCAGWLRDRRRSAVHERHRCDSCDRAGLPAPEVKEEIVRPACGCAEDEYAAATGAAVLPGLVIRPDDRYIAIEGDGELDRGALGQGRSAILNLGRECRTRVFA